MTHHHPHFYTLKRTLKTGITRPNKLRPGSCSCIDAKSTSNVIPSDGWADFDLIVRTAAQAKGPRQVYSVFVHDRDDNIVDLHMTYELAGLMCFIDGAVYAKIPPSEDTINLRIPMLITKPVSPGDASIRCDGDLAGLSALIESSGGQHFLVATGEIGRDAAAGFSGAIHVKDTTTGRECMLQCLIQRETNIVISPATLRFRHIPDTSSGNRSRIAGTSGRVSVQ